MSCVGCSLWFFLNAYSAFRWIFLAFSWLFGFPRVSLMFWTKVEKIEKIAKKHNFFSFSSVRDMNLFPQEAHSCLWKNKTHFFFFLMRMTYIYFLWRHRLSSVRDTIMPLGKGKKIWTFSSARHIFTSRRGTELLPWGAQLCLLKRGKTWFFFSFTRGTDLFLQEAWIFFRERHSCITWKREKNASFFREKYKFTSHKGMNFLPREAL